MVVGGYAVGFHGYPRYTGDLDIWVERSDANIKSLIKAVTAFGGPSALIEASQLLKNQLKKTPALVWVSAGNRYALKSSVQFRVSLLKIVSKDVQK